MNFVERQLKIILSITNSAALVVVFIAAVTITADLFLPLKDWLKLTFTHHWIGKSILSVGLFLVVTILFFILPEKTNSDKIIARLWTLIFTTIVSFLAIAIFFIYEAFIKI